MSRQSSAMYRVTIAIFAAIATAAAAAPSGADARRQPGSTLGEASVDDVVGDPMPPIYHWADPLPARRVPPPLLATLLQTHTDERVPLDESSPSDEAFSMLLADPVSGEAIAIDPRLPALLRALARTYPRSRIELVSGYRSAKLNEAMRQAGHHVAAHSQHSLGHAVDLRIVPAGETLGVDPRILEQRIRNLGWGGGVGVYSLASDWFVHADVGANRRWDGN